MEKRLRISAHIPLQPLSRISTVKEKSCAKGLFDEKYNNNPKYSLIERRLPPCCIIIIAPNKRGYFSKKVPFRYGAFLTV